MNLFQQYIENCLNEVECPKEEREDIREELKTHLMESKQTYLEEGYTEKEAEQRTLVDFGVDIKIGKQLQQSMYPFRILMFYCLGIGSLLFTTVTFLLTTSILGSAPFIWLLFSLVIGSCLTLYAMNPSFIGDRKIIVNGTLGSLLISLIFGMLQLSTMGGAIGTTLYLLALPLFVLAIIMIYYTTLINTSPNINKVNWKKGIHLINISIGFIILTYAGFLIWGTLAFGFYYRIVLIAIVGIFGWAVSYWIQFKTIDKYPLVTVCCALFTVIAGTFPIYSLFMPIH
ncbi:permease prefix domain 1-containing protein [Evansella tamaricis]|uniref:Uncharacterized protein n=1 Tax=Evansella tamaricis TaxID=2069301 RepID=A0ABS6JG44_9BACI|nr:hypothetical protein [Evansella tamaricis]